LRFRPAASLALLALAVGGCRPENAKRETPLLVVGIVGGDRTAIESLWDRGELPALRRLAKAGSFNALTTDFGISPVIWTTIATGVEPAEHGITDFVVPTERGDIPVSSAVRRRPAIWNMLTRVNRRVAVLGWWATWPAEPVSGLLVSDRATLGVGKEISPGELSGELAGWLESARTEGAAFGGNPTSELQDRVVAIAARQVLEKPPELVLAYFRSVDLASHDFWHRFAPAEFPRGAPRGAADSRDPDPVRSAYRAVDEALASMLSAAPADLSVMVLSDHGFRAETANSLQILLDFDRLLERLGWLVRTPDGGIDTAQSRAWVVDSPDYRVVKRIRFAEGLDAAAASAELERDLARVRFAAPGPAFLVRPVNRRDRRHGAEMVATVDVEIAGPELRVDGELAPGIVTHFGRISGGHDRDTAGILLCAGPMFEPGARVSVSIRDIAPTILHALGLPVADDFSGAVAIDLLAAPIRNRPVRRIASWGLREANAPVESEADRKLLNELGALGYLR
jgi:predicted AlkP superfamily phosphohydrolase/phosphomutase